METVSSSMASVSIGVCAYNEEKNILHTLRAISSQHLEGNEIIEVIVVSSGSTDRTDALVQEYEAIDKKVRLIRQERREGKNAAVNAFLREARGSILVLVNADNVLDDGSLHHLLEPFQDPHVGIVGGRPIPVNDPDSLTGFAVHMIWDMHHLLSLNYPKIGELVAFRPPGKELTTKMQSDEDIIRMYLENDGFRPAYAPQAIVRNKGPTTIRDFMKQRTRVNIGERYMKMNFDYDIPTQDPTLLISAFFSFLRQNGKHPFLILMSMGLEMSARIYAQVYVSLDRGDQTVWSQVGSTKDLGDR
jgi:cellulose synthase/poly-beta-1,6-N-acetylglucosamine synthase-like glycosyltransferase